MKSRLFLLLITALCFVSNVSVCNASSIKALTPTPPMGWNSWNWHGKKDINESVVRETIDAMVETGLRDAGYEFVVIDGGWRDTHLGENGELLAHPDKFPNGIQTLADYAHLKGMKLGVHTVPGTEDCGGDPVGGFGYEDVHVKQFVEWGLDFIKLDKCRYNGKFSTWDEELVELVYRRWQDLLENCDRDIVYSISAYIPRPWYPEVCNMARTTVDIDARVTGGAVFHRDTPTKNFLSVMTIADLNNACAEDAGNGYWNDPDMLVTGEQGLSPAEQQSHFALWCMMSSPLMVGNDPRQMTQFELDLITNKDCIRINQDPMEQGRRVLKDGLREVWKKHLSDGSIAVLLLNRGLENDVVRYVPEQGMKEVREIFSGKSYPMGDCLEASLEGHASKLYLLR